MRRDAIQGRKPLAHQMMPVAGTEKSLRGAEQAAVLLVPADAMAGAECGQYLIFGAECRGGNVEEAGEERWTVLVGEHNRLFRLERITAAFGFVGDLARRGLRREPFADIALRGAGALG